MEALTSLSLSIEKELAQQPSPLALPDMLCVLGSPYKTHLLFWTRKEKKTVVNEDISQDADAEDFFGERRSNELFFFYWNADRSHLILLGEACRVLWQAVAGRPPRRKDGNRTKKNTFWKWHSLI